MQARNQCGSLKFVALNGVCRVGCVSTHVFYIGESLKRVAKMAKAKFRNWIADVRADFLSTICPVDVGTS